MRVRITRQSRIALSAIAVSATLGVGLWPARAPRLVDERDAALGAASGPKARTLYARWKRTHEALGGDRNIAIALGAGRGTAQGPRTAMGLARLDFIGGRARVEVRGLDPQRRWDVWLVDNQGQGGALPDAGD